MNKVPNVLKYLPYLGLQRRYLDEVSQNLLSSFRTRSDHSKSYHMQHMGEVLGSPTTIGRLPELCDKNPVAGDTTCLFTGYEEISWDRDGSFLPAS